MHPLHRILRVVEKRNRYATIAARFKYCDTFQINCAAIGQPGVGVVGRGGRGVGAVDVFHDTRHQLKLQHMQHAVASLFSGQLLFPLASTYTPSYSLHLSFPPPLLLSCVHSADNYRTFCWASLCAVFRKRVERTSLRPCGSVPNRSL